MARGASLIGARDHHDFSVAFGDYDRDGWLDMHTNEWHDPVVTLPTFTRLLHNLGASSPGVFEDTTDAAGVALGTVDGARAFTSSFVDLDDDGWPDLAVAGDFGTSRLFWNHRDGTFTDGTTAAGVGTDENGMGSALGDYDGDGRIDWFVTSIYDPVDSCEGGICGWAYSGNRLYRNLGARSFTDVTDVAGVRDGAWGWGAAFLDYDNDGDQDLVMATGVNLDGTDMDQKFNATPLRFWRNDGAGGMTEVAAALGLAAVGDAKGLLVFDYDDDGDLDLFVVEHAGPGRLFRNEGGNAFGWLRVKLIGTQSNRDGIGARITLTDAAGKKQIREVVGGSNYLAQSELVAHFGLGFGTAPVGEIRIVWPKTGAEQVLTNVARNQTLVVTEP